LRRLILATVLWLAAANAAPAQEPSAGTRLRVTAPDLGLKKRVVIVQSIRGDTLHALLGSDTIAVPLAAATRVDVSQGRHRHRLRWTAIGAAAGGAAALGLIEILSATNPGYEDPTVIFGLIFAAPALVAGGTLTGAIAAPLTEDWQTVVLGGPDSFRRGTRVRVWARDPALSGTAMRIDTVRAGVYVLSSGGRTVEVPIASVTRMEVWRGGTTRSGSALRGAGIGTVAGGAYGLAVVSLAGPIEEGDGFVLRRATAAGAVIGALWGAARPGGHWRPAPNARFAVAPAHGGGTRLGIDVRF
jgi:hypothetical protein